MSRCPANAELRHSCTSANQRSETTSRSAPTSARCRHAAFRSAVAEPAISRFAEEPSDTPSVEGLHPVTRHRTHDEIDIDSAPTVSSHAATRTVNDIPNAAAGHPFSRQLPSRRTARRRPATSEISAKSRNSRPQISRTASANRPTSRTAAPSSITCLSTGRQRTQIRSRLAARPAMSRSFSALPGRLPPAERSTVPSGKSVSSSAGAVGRSERWAAWHGECSRVAGLPAGRGAALPPPAAGGVRRVLALRR
jgi:hypothetical protein